METPKEKLTKVAALRRYFSTQERPLILQEIKMLTMEEREYLAQLAAQELNVELVVG